MDWNGNLKSFPPRPETSFNFLYGSNYEPYPGMEMKHQGMLETLHGMVPAIDKSCIYGNQDKKKRLTSDQLDSLERSFQDEIKLDPERKIKLSRELGLQPRQIAVWFQNRRARWKAKQLERLYDALKQDFDVISREKQRLQDEVFKLKAMMREHSTTKKQVSTTGYTEISGDETVESTSVAMTRSSNKVRGGMSFQQIGECNYVFNVDDYNPVVSHPYWPATTTLLPSYP